MIKTQSMLGVEHPRVLMILNRYHPMIGGAERQCERLCEQLGHRVRWVAVLTHRYAQELDREASVANVRVFRLGKPARRTGVSPVSFYLNIAWYLLRHAGQIDLVHCHTAGFTGLWVGVLGRLLGKPVLLKLTALGELAQQVHWSRAEPGFAANLKMAVRRAVARFALAAPNTHVVALTSAGGTEAQQAGAAHVHVIPNGVDADRYRHIKSGAPLLSRPVIFGYAGRLTAEKGTDTLAAAFEMLLNQRAQVQLRVIGSAERQRSPSTENLLRLKASFPSQFDLCEAVPDTVSFLQSLDVYVSASTYEGLPNAVLEALACGLPCVLSDIDAHRELSRLNPGAHIEFFAPDDPVGCATAIRRCASTKPLPTSQLSTALHMGAIAERYLALYRTIAQRSRHAEPTR